MASNGDACFLAAWTEPASPCRLCSQGLSLAWQQAQPETQAETPQQRWAVAHQVHRLQRSTSVPARPACLDLTLRVYSPHAMQQPVSWSVSVTCTVLIESLKYTACCSTTHCSLTLAARTTPLRGIAGGCAQQPARATGCCKCVSGDSPGRCTWQPLCCPKAIRVCMGLWRFTCCILHYLMSWKLPAGWARPSEGMHLPPSAGSGWDTPLAPPACQPGQVSGRPGQPAHMTVRTSCQTTRTTAARPAKTARHSHRGVCMAPGQSSLHVVCSASPGTLSRAESQLQGRCMDRKPARQAGVRLYICSRNFTGEQAGRGSALWTRSNKLHMGKVQFRLLPGSSRR